MDYLLVFLTMSGRDYAAAKTLASFEEHVWPEPKRRFMHVDGPMISGPPNVGDWTVWKDDPALGFCEACRVCWNYAAASEDIDWVFWLEDDFEFIRPVDLNAVATAMKLNPQVTQMALNRNAVNEEERQYGGPTRKPGREFKQRGARRWSFLEHQHYWTTNPSLFRTETARQFAWPQQERCEGHLGFRILNRNPDATFGVWGDGAEWVNHFGERIGVGY